MVEGISPCEHSIHIRDTAGNPFPDILVKSAGIGEHSIHISDTAGSPAPDILVERTGIGEHKAHNGYTGQVGAVHRLPGKVAAAGESVFHGGPDAGAPLLNREQFFLIAAVIEINAGEARSSAAIITDAHGVSSYGRVGAGVIAIEACRFQVAIIIAIDVIVVAFACGGNGELRGVRGARVICLDCDHKIIFKTTSAAICDGPAIQCDHLMARAFSPAIGAVPAAEGDARLQDLGIPTHQQGVIIDCG